MSEQPDIIRVLLVEDDEDDMVLTRALLTDIKAPRYELDWVSRVDEALERIVQGRYDVCLADYRMGAHDGVTFVRHAVEQGAAAPIIVLTGQGDREVDVAAMEAGAADFLNKGELSAPALERSIRYAIQHHKVQEQRLNLLREQAARAEAESANQAKDQFLAALSHELRTPLTPALVILDALLEDGDLAQTVREDLETIRRNVQLEARLIDDLLDLTRVARGKIEINREALDVHELIRHSATMVQHDCEQAGLTLTLELKAQAAWVEGDSARLQQVFWNLLKNAVKFTSHGGISVRTMNDNAGGVVIEVRDTGMGIEPENLARIFDAFEQGGRAVTRRYGGLGLGLAISKKLVTLHGGTLEAASDGRGHGSVFTVTLHAVAHAPPPDRRAPEAAPQMRGLRLLLVEDHPSTAEAMRRLLTGMGHEVIVATTVQEGLAQAGKETFDLLISDLGLPDGDGLDLMRELRPTGLRGVCLSGYGMDADIRRSKDAGFSVHLVKPVDFRRLAAAISEATACATPL